MEVGEGGGEVVVGEAAWEVDVDWVSDWSSRRRDWRSASACSSRVSVRGVSVAVSGEGEAVWDDGMVNFVSVWLGVGVEWLVEWLSASPAELHHHPILLVQV